jgi:hypothetical protein
VVALAGDALARLTRKKDAMRLRSLPDTFWYWPGGRPHSAPGQPQGSPLLPSTAPALTMTTKPAGKPSVVIVRAGVDVDARRGPLWSPWGGVRPLLAVCCLLLLLALALAACNDQSQKPDPRLKYFTILNSRVLIADNNVEVFGEVENTSQMKFPFDVTMQADLMDNSGQSVGNANGTAEDVGPGQVRQFILTGTVDGSRFAKLKVTAISLQEKRQELGLPTPTPISP